jgi:hypothetical protein
MTSQRSAGWVTSSCCLDDSAPNAGQPAVAFCYQGTSQTLPDGDGRAFEICRPMHTAWAVGDLTHAKAQVADREASEKCSGARNLRSLQHAVRGRPQHGQRAVCDSGTVQLTSLQASRCQPKRCPDRKKSSRKDLVVGWDWRAHGHFRRAESHMPAESPRMPKTERPRTEPPLL